MQMIMNSGAAGVAFLVAITVVRTAATARLRALALYKSRLDSFGTTNTTRRKSRKAKKKERKKEKMK